MFMVWNGLQHLQKVHVIIFFTNFETNEKKNTHS